MSSRNHTTHNEHSEGSDPLMTIADEAPSSAPALIARAVGKRNPDELVDSQVTLHDIFTMLYKARWLMLWMGLLGASAGWFYSQGIKPSFSTKSTISITVSNKNDASVTLNSQLQKQEQHETQLQLFLPMLNSFSLVEKVLDENDFGSEIAQKLNLRKREDASKKTGVPNYSTQDLQRYLSTLKFQSVPGTSLVNIIVTADQPLLAAQIANAHAEEFVDLVQQRRMEEIESNNRFLKRRLREVAQDLKRSEAALIQYAKQNEIFLTNLEGGYTTTLGSVYGDLMSKLNTVMTERAKLESLTREAKRSRGKAALDQSKELNNLEFQLRTMQGEYSRRLDTASLRRDDPELKNLKKNIRDTRNQINNLRRNAINDLEANYDAAKKQESELREEIEKVRSEGFEQSKILVQFNLLSTKYKSSKDLYDKLSTQLQEAYASAESEKINIVVTDRAIPPSSHFNRNEPLYITAGGVSLALFAFAISFLLNMLDTTIRTIEDIEEALMVPCFGAFPKYFPSVSKSKVIQGRASEKRHYASSKPNSKQTPDMKSEEVSYLELLGAGNFSLSSDEGEVSRDMTDFQTEEKEQFENDVTLDNPFLVMLSDSTSPEAESIRNIRTAMMLSTLDLPPKVISLTSAQKGEGKTTISMNLAAALAQDDQLTVVIDADMRRPGLSEFSNISLSRPGLSTILSGKTSLDEAILQTNIPGLHVIPAGTLPRNPAELLNSHAMQQMVAELRTRYDRILLDCPPILPVADGLICAKQSDAVIFVIRSGKTTREVARRAHYRLNHIRAYVSGTILNSLDLTNKAYNYRYRESYGYYGKEEKKSKKKKGLGLPTSLTFR